MADRTAKISLDVGDVASSAREAAAGIKSAAKEAESAVKESAKSQAAAQKEAAKAATDAAKAHKEAATTTKSAVDGIKSAITSFVSSAHPSLGKVTQGFTTIGPSASTAAAMCVSAYAAIGAAALAAVASVAKLTTSMAELAIHQSDLKNDTTGDWAQIMGSQKKAAELYEKLMQVAINSGQKQEAVLARAGKMLSTGFKAPDITAWTQLFADFEQFKGAGSSAGLESLIEKIKSLGKFDAKGLKGLAAQGIATKDVIAEIAKQTGYTTKEIEKFLNPKGEKGKKPAHFISAETAIKAIQELLKKKFGGAAGIDTLGIAIDGIKLKLLTMFDGVNTKPLIDAAKAAMKALDGIGGKNLKAGITSFFSALFQLVAALFSGGTMQKGQAAMTGMGKVLQSLAGMMRSAVPAVTAFSGKVADLISKAGTLTPYLKTAAAGFGLMVTVLGKFMAAIAGPQIAIAKFGTTLITGVVGAISKVTSAVTKLGQAITNGLKAALDAGKGGIVASLVAAVTAAIAAAKAAAGISSPSTVMFGFGTNMGEGMTLGMAGQRGALAKGGAGMSNAAASGVASGKGGAAKSAADVNKAMGDAFTLGFSFKDSKTGSSADKAKTAASSSSAAAGSSGSSGSGGTASGSNAQSGSPGGGTSVGFPKLAGSSTGNAKTTVNHNSITYHPPAVSVTGNPADTKAHTEAAQAGGMAAFGDHLADALQRMAEG